MHDLLVLVHEARMKHVEDAAESLISDNGIEQALALIVDGAVVTADDHRAAWLRDLWEIVEECEQRDVAAVLQI